MIEIYEYIEFLHADNLFDNLLISKKMDDEIHTNLDQQIDRIFKAVTLSSKSMSAGSREKAKELMILNVQKIVGQALKRSMCRDGYSNTVEMKDLLAVIQKRGEIYKFKIARTIIMNKIRSENKSNDRGDQNLYASIGSNFQVDENQPMSQSMRPK